MIGVCADFALARHSGRYENWPLLTPLCYQGRPTGRSIPGYVIEAQYRWRGYYLLVTSWDCPFEEANDFLLLDGSFKLISKKRLGAPYATVLLESHRIVDDRRLLFCYAGGLGVRVTLADAPLLALTRRPRIRLRHVSA